MRRPWLVVGLWLSACAGPNLYVSGRPVGPGVVQHAIALEGLGAVTPAGSAILPVAPTWQVRVGVSRAVDVMARLSNLSGLGLDALVSMAEGPVDLALVPGVRGTWLPFSAARPGLVVGHLPLLVGVPLGERWRVVATAGVGYAAAWGASASAQATSAALAESPEASSAGFFWRAGVGAQWRATQRLVLHPEVTVLYTPRSRRLVVAPGLAFVFGGGL